MTHKTLSIREKLRDKFAILKKQHEELFGIEVSNSVFFDDVLRIYEKYRFVENTARIGEITLTQDEIKKSLAVNSIN